MKVTSTHHHTLNPFLMTWSVRLRGFLCARRGCVWGLQSVRVVSFAKQAPRI